MNVKGADLLDGGSVLQDFARYAVRTCGRIVIGTAMALGVGLSFNAGVGEIFGIKPNVAQAASAKRDYGDYAVLDAIVVLMNQQPAGTVHEKFIPAGGPDSPGVFKSYAEYGAGQSVLTQVTYNRSQAHVLIKAGFGGNEQHTAEFIVRTQDGGTGYIGNAISTKAWMDGEPHVENIMHGTKPFGALTLGVIKYVQTVVNGHTSAMEAVHPYASIDGGHYVAPNMRGTSYADYICTDPLVAPVSPDGNGKVVGMGEAYAPGLSMRVYSIVGPGNVARTIIDETVALANGTMGVARIAVGRRADALDFGVALGDSLRANGHNAEGSEIIRLTERSMAALKMVAAAQQQQVDSNGFAMPQENRLSGFRMLGIAVDRPLGQVQYNSNGSVNIKTLNQ